jgi:hypothetical protein
MSAICSKRLGGERTTYSPVNICGLIWRCGHTYAYFMQTTVH